MQRKWFGREPALVIQGIGAVLSAFVVFKLPGWDDQLVAAITAFLTAVAAAYTAVYVRPWAPTIFSGIVVAGFTLLASFGLEQSQERTGAVTIALAAFMAFWARPQQNFVGSPARPEEVLVTTTNPASATNTGRH